MQNRRTFLKYSGQSILGLTILGVAACGTNEAKMAQKENADTAATTEEKPKELFFKLSLAQWSLHKALFANEMDNLDFPDKAKELGFAGVEWVSAFFGDKITDKEYLAQVLERSKKAGVENVLIMVDRQGDLANNDEEVRTKAVESHKAWVDAAKFLGCHSIRVNLFGNGSAEEWHNAAVDGLGRLAQYGQTQNINVIVENHGGLSSDSAKLVAVMKEINLPNCGTLPDFGNFCIERDSGKAWEGECIKEYDKYQGTEEMMPFAKAVSAKSYNFDDAGQETKIDFAKMLKIVKSHNYAGFIGVEYEGEVLSEVEGIKATRELLVKEGMKLS